MTVAPFNGNIGAGPFSSMTVYAFLGPQATVNFATGQQMTAAASIPIALSSGGPTPVRLGLCYQQGTGTITNFVGGAYSIVVLTTDRTSQSASASVSGLAAGTYKVGACILNSSTTAVSNNDYVNGWVMVHN